MSSQSRTVSSAASSTDAEFFREKREWSKIKDQILAAYLTPYLTKVRRLGRAILLVDGYAGPGVFDDGTAGSPLIICRIADHVAPGRYTAVFANANRNHHDRLSANLQDFSPSGRVIPVHGAAADVLRVLNLQMKDQTVFAYLDPYASPSFDMLQPLLSRDKMYSTEVVINLNAQEMPRLAAIHAARRGSPAAAKLQAQLTARLGGDYWRPIFEDDASSTEAKLLATAAEYCCRLGEFLPFTGCCPIREDSDGLIRYFIVFCSRHEDSMLLMNDVMFKAYHQGIHQSETRGTLFEVIDWRVYRHFVAEPEVELKTAVLDAVGSSPGLSRRHVWSEIVRRYFMAYSSSEFKQCVRDLVTDQAVRYDDVRRTGRLNDDSRLHLC